MGKRGPAPKPTALKILAGNPGKKPLPADEPKPLLLDVADCPETMPPVGRAKWNETVGELRRLGMLTSLDTGALEMYCRYWAVFIDAMEFMQEKGNILPLYDNEGEIRTIKAMPQVNIAGDAADRCIQLGRELGLSPASRSRIQITAKPVDVNELESKYFKR